MKTDTDFDFEYFRHGSLRLLKATCGSLVSIPSGSELQGFLAVDKESGKHAQVRFLKSQSPELRAAYNSVWNSFRKVSDSLICPQVYAVSEYNGLPCCVSSLPEGEPLNHFINRNGDLPAEVAVRLVLAFAKNLRRHSPSFFRQFAISPESIWISRTKEQQPKLLLGELSPVKHSNPEEHNVELCIEILKYITGNPARENRFQGLLTQLCSGPGTLEFVERLLSCFADANPAANYWMGFNDPESLLERIISAEEAARKCDRSRESKIVETAKKTLWPAMIAGTLTVGGFITYCLYTFSKDPALAPAYTEQEAAPPVVQYSRPLVVSPPAPRPQPVIKPAPAPAPVIVSSSTPAVSVPRPNPKVTPMLKNLLGDTGELFHEFFYKPQSEWLIKDEPGKEDEKDKPFTAEDEIALKMLELRKSAAHARERNLPFEAIKYEVALLKLKPDLIDARIRLHDYLSQIQHMAINRKEISPEEIEILVEASSENSKARDILNTHYRNGARM